MVCCKSPVNMKQCTFTLHVNCEPSLTFTTCIYSTVTIRTYSTFLTKCQYSHAVPQRDVNYSIPTFHLQPLRINLCKFLVGPKNNKILRPGL